MPNQNKVRLTVSISKDTIEELRSMLGESAGRRGELSRYIEQAVQNQILFQTMREVHEQNRGVDPELLEREIDEAIQDVRREKSMDFQHALAGD